MRRKDREVTEEARIDEIISRCHCCRLGFNDGGEVYIVPMNFGWVKRDGKRYFYFHSAKEGAACAAPSGQFRIISNPAAALRGWGFGRWSCPRA